MADKIKPKEPEALYGSFFDNVLDGLVYCQMIFAGQSRPVDFICVKVNKNFEKLMGLKDVQGKKASELIPGITTSNPEMFEIYGRVALGGKPERFETYVKPLARWFLVSVYSPKKEFFTAVFQNITDQKQIEQDLENANIAVRNVLEDLSVEKSEVEIARAKEEAILLSIGDGLISTDEKGNITFINKSAEKLLGLKNEEIMGKLLSETIDAVDEKKAPVPLQKRPVNMALSTGTTTTTTHTGPTYYYVRKDKTKFPVAITVTPVKLEDKIIGVIEVFRDITREKEVDRAKSEFVSLASHQLRTPLSAIKWYSKMLLNEDVGKVTEKQKEYPEEIHSGNERMVSLVNALLSVSRIELGTFAVVPQKVNLVTVCKEVLEGVKEDIAHKGLNVKEEFKKVPAIEADPNYIRIIFQNLITNTIKYTPEKGTITITISENRTDLLISIKDTGCGIPEKAKKMIFTKLFRADNVVDKDPDGIGLGLYITKSIVEQAAKGKIWFESEENKGTTFFVSLPLTGMIKREGVKGLI